MFIQSVVQSLMREAGAISETLEIQWIRTRLIDWEESNIFGNYESLKYYSFILLLFHIYEDKQISSSLLHQTFKRLLWFVCLFHF
jgi:hypothetical protein